jgi:hypothetical protein
VNPRPDVIRRLSQAALAAMIDAGIDDMSPNEVVSACYTLCRHVTEVLIAQCDGPAKIHNQYQLTAAIMELYNLVKPEVVN